MEAPLEKIADIWMQSGYLFLCLPLVFILVFAVHEGGHYLMARLMKMDVHQVTLGAGRTLRRWRDRYGTLWRVKLWPVRAHVDIGNYYPQAPHSLWRRLAVVLAGPAANIMLAFLLFCAFFLIAGKPYAPPVATGIEVGFPAYEAGIRPGDRIVAINGRAVETATQVRDVTKHKTDAPLRVSVARGDTVRDLAMIPRWAEYRDRKGVKQAHARIGIMHHQLPFKLAHLRAVAGQAAAGEEEARALLRAHRGQRVILALDSSDRQVRDYLVDVPVAANRYLDVPGHQYHDLFWIGAQADNNFMALGPAAAAQAAVQETGRLVRGLGALPFHLFPVDAQRFKPEILLSGRKAPVKAALYRLVFMAALLSLLVGLINLLPLPGLDGSVVLCDSAEKLTGQALSPRGRALLISAALVALYGAAFLMNAAEMPGYFSFLTQRFSRD